MKKLLLTMLIFGICFSTAYAQDEVNSPWGHESELGVALSGGNSDSKTFTAKQKTTYTFGKNLLRIDGWFVYGYSAGAENAKNWMIGLRYERALTNLLSVFLGHSWEGDQFAGYDYRANVDAGAKFYFLPGDKKENYLFGEAGYRFSYENKISAVTPQTDNLHFARAYIEGAKSLTKILFMKAWVEFLPDLTDKDNFQLNFEPSLNVIISKYFSLKLGYMGKFDNVPAQTGLKKYDWIYTTALVGKF